MNGIEILNKLFWEFNSQGKTYRDEDTVGTVELGRSSLLIRRCVDDRGNHFLEVREPGDHRFDMEPILTLATVPAEPHEKNGDILAAHVICGVLSAGGERLELVARLLLRLAYLKALWP